MERAAPGSLAGAALAARSALPLSIADFTLAV